MIYFYNLSQALIYSASGPDCVRYLNARLSNDVKKLSVNQSCLAAALTPQGRTQGLFIVIRTNSEDYLLVSSGGDSQVVLEALKKYKVADRVDIEDISGRYSLFHVFPTSDNEQNLLIQCLPKTKFEVQFDLETIFVGNSRASHMGTDVIVPSSSAELFKNKLINAGIIEIDSPRFNLLRMIAGEPSFPEEINEKYLLSAFSLPDVVSHNKGCYVGQEVVEKVSALGKIPNVIRPAVFNGKSNIDLTGMEITLEEVPETKVGKVVSSCYDNDTAKIYTFIEIKNDEEFFNKTLQIKDLSGRLKI